MPTSFPMANPWADNTLENAVALYNFITVPINDLAAASAYSNADTGWVTTGVVAAGNGSVISSIQMRKAGGVIHVSFGVTLVAAMTVPASGDLTNTILANITDVRFRSSSGAAGNLQAGGAGPVASYYCDPSTGNIVITACSGGATLNAGTAISVNGTYLD